MKLFDSCGVFILVLLLLNNTVCIHISKVSSRLTLKLQICLNLYSILLTQKILTVYIFRTFDPFFQAAPKYHMIACSNQPLTTRSQLFITHSASIDTNQERFFCRNQPFSVLRNNRFRMNLFPTRALRELKQTGN